MIRKVDTGGFVPVPEPSAGPMAGGGGGFAEAFEKAVKAVDAPNQAADEKIYGVATGTETDPANMIIALEQASIALRTMASTRDKLVEAYQQIWNMPI
jgi:flagellar hook-basal body complex protein FliE